MTAVQDLANRLTHLCDRFQPETQTAAETIGTHHQPVSARTVWNLRNEGIRPYWPYVGSVLTQRHRQDCVAWCRTRQCWTLQRWSQVAFSDEKKFHCFRADGRERVYRRHHERCTDACVCQVDRWGDPSAMVLAAISADHHSDLVFIGGNLMSVTGMISWAQLCYLSWSESEDFQHDNAHPHVACVCTHFLMEKDVHMLPWPSISPDLNSIENLWAFLSMHIQRRVNPLQTAQQLRAALVEEWAAIPQDQIRRYCRSMRRRITAVLDTNGGHLNYWTLKLKCVIMLIGGVSLLGFGFHWINWPYVQLICSYALCQMCGCNRNIIFLSLNILPEIFQLFFSGAFLFFHECTCIWSEIKKAHAADTD